MDAKSLIELMSQQIIRRETGEKTATHSRPDDPVPKLLVILTDVVGEVAIQLAALRELHEKILGLLGNKA